MAARWYLPGGGEQEEEVVEMSWSWSTEPSLVLLILAVAAGYRFAMTWARQRFAPQLGFPAAESRWMLGALAVFYLAVGSPLDEMGERFLLSAHMVQHGLLIFVMPIMLLKSLPVWLLEPIVEYAPTRLLARFVLHPISCIVGFNVLFSVWHIPGLYEWALRDPKVHDLEHIIFVVAGVWMWWPIFAPVVSWRLGYGMQMLYSFFMSISQMPIFFYMTFTTSILYPTYLHAPRLTRELDPSEDQVLGAIVMKLVGEIFFIWVIAVAIGRWRDQDQRGKRGAKLPEEGTAPVSLR
jgi:putative membrane protein